MDRDEKIEMVKVIEYVCAAKIAFDLMKILPQAIDLNKALKDMDDPDMASLGDELISLIKPIGKHLTKIQNLVDGKLPLWIGEISQEIVEDRKKAKEPYTVVGEAGIPPQNT